MSAWRIAGISPEPTPQEVAAITAALAVIEAEQAARAREHAAHMQPDYEHISAWVEASRRAAQRAALQRGPWRLSGRIGRRFRT